MINPNQVNHAKFPISSILYNDAEFSIVWGSWQGNPKTLGMRWNDSPGPNGFPTSRETFRPVWFVIPNHLALPLATSLLGSPHADNKAIIEVLNEIINRGDSTNQPAIVQ